MPTWYPERIDWWILLHKYWSKFDNENVLIYREIGWVSFFLFFNISFTEELGERFRGRWGDLIGVEGGEAYSRIRCLQVIEDAHGTSQEVFLKLIWCGDFVCFLWVSYIDGQL